MERTTELDKEIIAKAEAMQEKMTKRRRDIHKHPESGWTEFRTASLVIKELKNLGYTVLMGASVNNPSEQQGVPDAAVLEKCMKRAISEGADSDLVKKMAGGLTGVVGIMDTGRPGPTVALRFDMDCNDVDEAADEKHRPYKEGFSSVHKHCMHACGHDGHTTAGLGVAELLAEYKDTLCGRIKLIFQPAEEGVRGARCMLAAGVADDVDYLLASHLMPPKVGWLAYSLTGILATTKFDADFTGMPAHAGANPEIGHNAMLAAATAAINIQAIPRHSAGISRVNVGVLNAGTGRNVVPANAHLEIETRGETTEINEYVYKRAVEILEGAAKMQEVSVKITRTGSASGADSSPELAEHIRKTAERLGQFDKLEPAFVGASEDCSWFMERVQKNGGQAVYIAVGGSQAAVNHNNWFDFDERALVLDVEILTAVAMELLMKK